MIVNCWCVSPFGSMFCHVFLGCLKYELTARSLKESLKRDLVLCICSGVSSSLSMPDSPLSLNC